MAVVKIGQVKSTLGRTMAYIGNPEKTQNYLYTSSNCGIPMDPSSVTTSFQLLQAEAEQARTYGVPGTIKAHHIIQSFKPGEVHPKTAHDIGVLLIKEITADEYQWYVATHIDTGHIHNHIMFNPVNIVDLKRYRMIKSSLHDMREISNRLSKQYGLSVIEPAPTKSKPVHENPYMLASNATFAERLRVAIDAAVTQAYGLPELREELLAMGIEMSANRSALTFTHPETMKRSLRGHRLGPEYTEEALITRMGRTLHHQVYANNQLVSLVDESTAHVRLPGTHEIAIVVNRQNMFKHGNTWHVYLPSNRPSTLIDQGGTYTGTLQPEDVYKHFARPNPAINIPFSSAHKTRVTRGRTEGERRYFAVIDRKVNQLHQDMRTLNRQNDWARMTPEEQKRHQAKLQGRLVDLRDRTMHLIIRRENLERLENRTPAQDHEINELVARIDDITVERRTVREELAAITPERDKRRSARRKGPQL